MNKSGVNCRKTYLSNVVCINGCGGNTSEPLVMSQDETFPLEVKGAKRGGTSESSVEFDDTIFLNMFLRMTP